MDDGLATGATARASLRALRQRNPRRLVLAVPVGAPDAVDSLRQEADEVVCLVQPELMWAVGLWYEHFEPTGDDEIADLLAARRDDPPLAPILSGSEIQVTVDWGAVIVGDLALPKPAGAWSWLHTEAARVATPPATGRWRRR